MSPELLVIVPSRSRPTSLPRMIEAWRDTGAFRQGAAMVFAVDADDPEIEAYRRYCEASDLIDQVLLHVSPTWRPMVAKLNRVAAVHASGAFALGFAGDDHVPRTVGWVKRFLEELRDLGTGIVYGNDGIQGEALPTQWVMTADIVQTLGCMVPSEVEHLYCDNVIKALGDEAGCLRYLPDVFIEHMHAFAGKAPLDHGYIRVNNGAQYARDSAAFERWRDGEMPGHVSAVRALRSNVTGRSGAA